MDIKTSFSKKDKHLTVKVKFDKVDLDGKERKYDTLDVWLAVKEKHGYELTGYVKRAEVYTSKESEVDGEWVYEIETPDKYKTKKKNKTKSNKKRTDRDSSKDTKEEE